MKKMIVLLLSTSSVFSNAFTISDYEKKIKNFYSIKNVVEKTSKKDLEDLVRDFVMSSRPNRYFGSSGNKLAKDFIFNYLKKLNSSNTTLKTYSFNPNSNLIIGELKESLAQELTTVTNQKDPNVLKIKNHTDKKINLLKVTDKINGTNIVWEKKGIENPNEVITIFANYDTLNVNPKTLEIDTVGVMPGADRNATGVSMSLTLANLINFLEPKKTVRIVFLDGEELENLGFRSYLDNLNKEEKTIIAINLFMLGNDTKIKDTEQKIGNFKAYGSRFNDEINSSYNHFLKLGKNAYSFMDFKYEDQKYHLGINQLAIKAKYPLLTLSENWETDLNPRQQGPDDFVETINFQTFINSYKIISSSVVGLAFDIVK